MVPIHMYFVTQNVMFPITLLHMICQETSFFFPVPVVIFVVALDISYVTMVGL